MQLYLFLKSQKQVSFLSSQKHTHKCGSYTHTYFRIHELTHPRFWPASFHTLLRFFAGLPQLLSGKEPACQCQRPRKQVRSLAQEDPLEKEMATHSSILAWRISWTDEPGRLQSMGSLTVRLDWETVLSLFTFMHWRRKWQPTPVFLPGESQGRGSLVGCCLWGRIESDTTEAT